MAYDNGTYIRLCFVWQIRVDALRIINEDVTLVSNNILYQEISAYLWTFKHKREAMKWLMTQPKTAMLSYRTVHLNNYAHKPCLRGFVVIWSRSDVFITFMVAAIVLFPMQMKQPWTVCVNKSDGHTRNSACNHMKTMNNKPCAYLIG